MPSDDLASRAPPAHRTREPGGRRRVGQVTTCRPRLPITAHTERWHRTSGFLVEATTQNDGSGDLQVSHNARRSIVLRVSPTAGSGGVIEGRLLADC